MIPYSRVRLWSPHSPEEVARRLSRLLNRPRGWTFPLSWEGGHVPALEGEISPEAFQLQAKSWARIPYLPVLCGNIIAESKGCLVDVIIRVTWAEVAGVTALLAWITYLAVPAEPYVPLVFVGVYHGVGYLLSVLPARGCLREALVTVLAAPDRLPGRAHEGSRAGGDA